MVKVLQVCSSTEVSHWSHANDALAGQAMDALQEVVICRCCAAKGIDLQGMPTQLDRAAW